MKIMAIDPGPLESAFVRYDSDARSLLSFGKYDNDTVRILCMPFGGEHLVVEKIASYGMPVGEEVFDTCIAIGRFLEAWTPGSWTLMKRQEVKMHMCHSPRANDATIRQAVIDRFGGKALAIGTAKKPGPLHGVTGDAWQALALALTFVDQAVKARAA